jgi:hypothetical protein
VSVIALDLNNLSQNVAAPTLVRCKHLPPPALPQVVVLNVAQEDIHCICTCAAVLWFNHLD